MISTAIINLSILELLFPDPRSVSCLLPGGPVRATTETRRVPPTRRVTSAFARCVRAIDASTSRLECSG
jgi:hypothetical protein